MEPAREVGGDLYDFFETADGLCFFVGDVSGKGMPAALFMARTKSLIRIATELMRGRDGAPARPAEIIARVNRELCQNNTDMMFVTLFFAMLSPATGVLSYCNAGHNPPYHVHNGAITGVETPKDVILGVRARTNFQTGTLTLAPGDTLYVYSDGVTEAHNLAGELFSEERLEAVLLANFGRSSRQMIAGVDEALMLFVGTALPSDDITMLAVRRVEGP